MLAVSGAPPRKLSLSPVKPLPTLFTPPPIAIPFPPAPAVVAVMVTTAPAEVAATPTALPFPAALIEVAILDASVVGSGSINQIPVSVPVWALARPLVILSGFYHPVDQLLFAD